MTIGDILGIVSAVVAICLSAWALMVTCGLMFPAQAERARETLLAKPRANILLGLAIIPLPTVFALTMLGNPHPGLKLLGVLYFVVVLSFGALGGAGLSFVAGDRIQRMAPELSDYAVFVRGAGFLVVASIFPIVGWLGFGPIALCAAVGSGAKSVAQSMFHPRRQPEPTL